MGSMLRATAVFFWELIKIFLLAMVIIVPIRYFLVQPFFVRGASMEPTFLDGEYLVIDELSYRLREPERGEVVVFHYPQLPSQFFIKRIVGLPGETIMVTEGQIVIKNAQHPTGAILDESSYLKNMVRTGGNVSLVLKDDEYFVLGDNREASSDSRSWGSLPRHDIIGRAWLRAFPFTRWGVIRWERLGFVNLN